MEPNNLVVTVVCSRGLMLKGHPNLNCSVTLLLQSKGSLRSKCVTEKVAGTTDIEWKESCEFKLMEGSQKLTATVNHHTRLGGVDLIGKAEVPMNEAIDLSTPQWFPLHKKANDVKYRGEVLLQFKFSYVKPQLSVSNLSLNTIPKDSVLAKMKKKMKLGRGGKDGDSLSIVSAFPGFMHRSEKNSTDALNKTFHGQTSNSLGRPSRGGSSLDLTAPPLATSSPFHSPHPSNGHHDHLAPGSNLNLSNLSTAESFSNVSLLQRQNSRRSFASSGFGSNKSKDKKEDSPGTGQADWDLAAQVDRLRMDLAVKDSRLKDVEEYLDTLLKKVMETHPELLASSSGGRSLLPRPRFAFR